jgi:hypothetical protein
LTEPKKSSNKSLLSARALWATSLKYRPRPLKELTEFKEVTASRTFLSSSSWSLKKFIFTNFVGTYQMSK